MICLSMIVRNEAKFIECCLSSVKPLIDSWSIVDTGSTDGTQKIISKALKKIPGELHERPFVDFGHNRTEALALAGEPDWILELDADMTAEAHEDLKTWLEEDTCPEVDAWQIAILDSGTVWRLPRLVRGGFPWRYVGPVHEYLDTSEAITRPLLGLTLHHHGSSRHPVEKFDHYLTLLRPGVEAGDPRAVFYSAECLRFLGCNDAAIDLYTQRASMDSFEEEAWYAQYQAAKLGRNVTALMEAWKRRPWRHEPLSAAAAIIRETPNEDVLFKEV